MNPTPQPRYRYEKLPLSPEEARAEYSNRIAEAKRRADEARSEAMREEINYITALTTPPPTHRTVQVAVFPGEPGYDDIPPQFNPAPYQGDFRWVNPASSAAEGGKAVFEPRDTDPHPAAGICCSLDDARQQVLSCFHPDTKLSQRELDRLAQLVADLTDSAMTEQDNARYYRDLVVRCGELLGRPARTCDDGTIVPDVLCDKVPEVLAGTLSRCGGELEAANQHIRILSKERDHAEHKLQLIRDIVV